MVFTAGMTWLRQYLVLHTGNRIDAVLGSQVFRHLLRLPLPYFEQRPTGTLVRGSIGRDHPRIRLRRRRHPSSSTCPSSPHLPGRDVRLRLAALPHRRWPPGAHRRHPLLVAPIFGDKAQSPVHARRPQAVLPHHYVSGIATVKSLQMEADGDRKYGDLLAQYLAAGFSTKQVGNTYNVVANGLEQIALYIYIYIYDLAIPSSSGLCW